MALCVSAVAGTRAPMRTLPSGSPCQLIPRCESQGSDPKAGPSKEGHRHEHPTKLGVAAPAGLLGVALATSSTFAATGPLTARHAPGRALQGSAVVRAPGQRVTTSMPTATSTTSTTAAPTAMRTSPTTMMPTATSSMPRATSASGTTMMETATTGTTAPPTTMPRTTSTTGTTMMETATSTSGTTMMR